MRVDLSSVKCKGLSKTGSTKRLNVSLKSQVCSNPTDFNTVSAKELCKTVIEIYMVTELVGLCCKA